MGDDAFSFCHKRAAERGDQWIVAIRQRGQARAVWPAGTARTHALARPDPNTPVLARHAVPPSALTRSAAAGGFHVAVVGCHNGPKSVDQQ